MSLQLDPNPVYYCIAATVSAPEALYPTPTKCSKTTVTCSLKVYDVERQVEANHPVRKCGDLWDPEIAVRIWSRREVISIR